VQGLYHRRFGGHRAREKPPGAFPPCQKSVEVRDERGSASPRPTVPPAVTRLGNHQISEIIVHAGHTSSTSRRVIVGAAFARSSPRWSTIRHAPQSADAGQRQLRPTACLSASTRINRTASLLLPGPARPAASASPTAPSSTTSRLPQKRKIIAFCIPGHQGINHVQRTSSPRYLLPRPPRSALVLRLADPQQATRLLTAPSEFCTAPRPGNAGPRFGNPTLSASRPVFPLSSPRGGTMNGPCW